MTTKTSQSRPAEWYAREHAKCASDPWYFMTNYCYVRVPNKGAVKWEKWLHQQQLLDIIQGNNRVVILKARQLGISWFFAAYALWLCLFTPAANVLFFSRRQTESIEMKARVKFIWRHLPDFLQLPTGKDNDEVLEFPSMDSKVQSFPATEGAGRGETATLVVLDEWADMPYARELYAAVLPTAEHGTIVGISTAKGTNNLFYDTYWGAKKGENSYIPVFIPYNILKGRTKEWWDKQAKDMPGYLAHQEYPLVEADAFLTAGTCMFPIEQLHGMPTDTPLSVLGESHIWVPRNPDHRYSAGVDTALGIAGRDFSALQIVDDTTGEQVAKLRTRMPIEEFAVASFNLLREYNFPPVIVEEQPQGRLVILEWKRLGYPMHRIFHRSKGVPGWHTNESNRRNILAELEQAIRTGSLIIYSDDTVKEFLSFGYNEKKAKFEALTGHDDEVMSLALAVHQRVSNPPAIPEEAFKPRSYIQGGAGDYDLVTDLDFRRADPLKGREVVSCPECGGKRLNEDNEICQTCYGMAVVVRRLNGS